jgi:hypothetical protein
MDWQNAYQHADALGTAPYYGYFLGTDGHAAQTLQMTPDEIMDACLGDIAGQLATTQENYANAVARGLDLVAYEGGQHMVGVGSWAWNDDLSALFIETNRQPRMHDLYVTDLTGWYNATDGGLFAVFTHISQYTRWGSWGLFEWQDQDLASVPKWAGVMDFVSSTRICRGDTNCDGCVDFADVNRFILALVDPDEYAAQVPYCQALNADCNENGSVGFEDVNPFVELIVGY